MANYPADRHVHWYHAGGLVRARRRPARAGDIIVPAIRQPVRNFEKLPRAARGSERALLMNLRRGEGALFIVIR